ncbi:hypothetical protein [Bradyrhizobium sp. HKCCYLS20291]|uniref:hypothetical protein n=1 Tax=Bradyrhizobium sp. HKCCYLS20291 TaxID=3420766 RepID=UPI003EB81298
MSIGDTHTSQLSLFGRLADELTRQVIGPSNFSASLDSDGRPSLKKSDGFFAFVGLAPSPSEYRVRIDAPTFQQRIVAKVRPSEAPVELSFPGEDELYLTIVDVSAPQSRVTFDPIAFVPPIEPGAAVIGQGGFAATLVEGLEGAKVSFATLSSVAGLAPNQVLRIVRSRNLLVRPGSTYPFPAATTVVVVKLAAGDQGGPPVIDGRIEIRKINGNAPSTVNVGELTLSVFDLGGGPRGVLLLDEQHRSALSSKRGDVVFHFAGRLAITSIDVSIAAPGFQAKTQLIDLVAKSRTTAIVVLSKV